MNFTIDKDYIIRIRRQLHQVPELTFDLPKTLAIVRRELNALGIPYTEDMGQSSIVATLNEGVGHKTLGLRADMDALPIEEKTGLDFASTHPGKMHACGHDAHTAMLLGAAKALKAMEKDIKCCVKLVFQASEEGPSGAEKLCRDGLMQGIDRMIGCHIMPKFATGTVHVNQTCANASSHGMKIHLYGKSCHAGRPHEGVDAIAMGVRVFTDLQVMRTREINPFEPVVINVGEFHSGNANNVVSEYAMLHLTIRTLTKEADDRITQRIHDIVQGVASTMGGRGEIESYKNTPPLINDLGVAGDILTAAAKVVDRDKINPNKPTSLGAEDFAYYALEKPAAMFSLGVMPYDGITTDLHNGKMMINEDVLDIGPKVFVQFILDQMEN